MPNEPEQPDFIFSNLAELAAHSSEQSPVLAEAQAAGVDLAHLRHNLSLTPSQRLARLQAGIRMVRTLRAARHL